LLSTVHHRTVILSYFLKTNQSKNRVVCESGPLSSRSIW